MIERATIARLESRLQQQLRSGLGRRQELGSESLASSAWSGRTLELSRLPDDGATPAEPQTLTDLLALDDAVLVQSAYRFLLGRAPDRAGFTCHLQALRTGHLTKEELLVALRYSDEGRKKNAPIAGFREARMRLRLQRLPVIGAALRWLAAVASAARLVRRVHGVESRLVAYRSDVTSTVNGAFDALELSINTQVSDVHQVRQIALETARRSEQANEIAGRRMEALARRVDERLAPAELTLKYLEPLIQRLSRAVDAGGRGEDGATTTLAPGENLDTFYAAFEDRFRGSRELIKDRQNVYLPYLADLPTPHTAIDIGSGRGEWLELLRDVGWIVKGLDTNLVFAAQNRERGFAVEIGDGLTLLRREPDASASLVTAFHVIEHLRFEDWLALLDECRRVLRPGGMLILETPNPENLMVGALHFYDDPTHRNPIPPSLAEFVVGARGFADVAVLRLHDAEAPHSEVAIAEPLAQLLYGPQDYAVIARKH